MHLSGRLVASATTILVALTGAVVATEPSPAKQSVRGNTFISEQWPEMRIEVDARMRYLGSFSFRVGDIAAGDRYVWAEADGSRRIRRLFVIQSEGMLQTTNEVYRYSIKSPAKLGQNLYQHNVFLIDAVKDATDAPGKEADLLLRFLRVRRYKVEHEQVVSRFARHGGRGEKHEIIFLYFENLREYRRSLHDFPNHDEHPTDEQKKIEKAVETNSFKAFRVVE